VASAVLDSSALLAFLAGEPGAEAVAAVIGDAVVSSVNYAEVIAKLIERGGSLDQARATMMLIDLDVVDFDRSLAEQAGALILSTRSIGLSLGDRACLALAAREEAPAVTADRAWASLKLNVEIQLIR
jgi:ribonuclease VapC